MSGGALIGSSLCPAQSVPCAVKAVRTLRWRLKGEHRVTAIAGTTREHCALVPIARDDSSASRSVPYAR
jgi:hypothetical protein